MEGEGGRGEEEEEDDEEDERDAGKERRGKRRRRRERHRRCVGAVRFTPAFTQRRSKAWIYVADADSGESVTSSD